MENCCKALHIWLYVIVIDVTQDLFHALPQELGWTFFVRLPWWSGEILVFIDPNQGLIKAELNWRFVRFFLVFGRLLSEAFVVACVWSAAVEQTIFRAKMTRLSLLQQFEQTYHPHPSKWWKIRKNKDDFSKETFAGDILLTMCE